MSLLVKKLRLCKWNCVGTLIIGTFLLVGCSGTGILPSSSDKLLLTPITDSPTNTYHTGKFVWADLLTPDADSARKFYGGLFGWSFKQYGRYTMITSNGKRVAGIVEVKPESKKDIEALWLTSMSVADVDKAIEVVREKGGAVLNGPVDMEKRGRGALIKDPQGAQLLLLRAVGGDPEDTDSVAEIGDWIWNEIWTNVPQKTNEFYTSLAGYDTAQVGSGYEILSREGIWRGGIRYIFKDTYRVRWVPAVRVSDPEKMLDKVEQLGGVVLLTPDEPPSNGDTALIADPDGALLMLQRWSSDPVEEEK